MEQEGAFLEALPKAAKFRLEGGNLVLLTAKGTILATLEPAPEEDSD
jgi:heat shock protein HslJ